MRTMTAPFLAAMNTQNQVLSNLYAVVNGNTFQLDSANVSWEIGTTGSATLTVYDETGRMLFTQKGQFAKGYNAISVDRALLNTTGLMYYKLETATDAATKKMIQTK